MKKHQLFNFWLFSILLLLPALMTNGQNGTAYQMKITGVAQVSCNVYELDVTMNSTVPSNLVRLANFQCGILVNPAIVPAGASIEIALVPGSSTIPVSSMQPGPEKFLYNNSTNCIQVAPVVPPGTANSFNVSMTGVKLFRIRVACTQPFLTGENTNHTWNFNLATAYPTKVFGYISGVNTDITAQASHLKVTPADVTLAGGYPDPIAQTVTSDVTEFCNIPGAGATITLGSTQVGYTYYLYSDGVRVPGQNGIIYGNGSSQSFGALASGSIMSVTSVGCVGEIPMLNTIALTPITPVSVSVSIAASPGTTVAPGTLVTFTATPVNGGDFPFTIWSVNGVPDYNTFDPVYYYTPVDGDQIFCEFYPSSEVCTEDMMATSNVLVMTVATLPVVFNVTGGGTICQGDDATIDLSGSETLFTYQLYKDGVAFGPVVPGTGLPLSWTVSDAGIYTVMADATMMNGSAEVIVIPTTTNTTVVTECDSYTWPYNSQTYTVSGIYEVVTGCHTEILDLTIIPSSTNTTVLTECDSYFWAVSGQTYTMTGVYTEEVGCVTEVLDLTIIPSTSNTTTLTVCDSYTWAENGMTYTASGIYTVVTGCHTEILDLTVIPSSTNTTVMTACDSYTWAVTGLTYTTSGIYTEVIGCVTEVLDLTIIPSSTNTTVLTECDSYFWAVSGQTYTMTGIYTEVVGCVTEILDLTIIPSTSNTTTLTVCDSYTWAENGMTYTTSGIYTVVTGCHTEILDLTVIPTSTNTTVLTECDSYFWAVNGQTYTTSGIYTEVIGCITEVLDLTILPSTSNTTTLTVCDSYTWVENGMTYTASGIYTVVTGCHTEILDLTVIPSTSNTTTLTVCDSYTWAENGMTYTASGIYTVVTGCHTEILDLTVIPSTSNTTTLTVCDSYTWAENGMTYTVSGIYTSVTGCHTEILDLTVIPSTSNTTTLTVCDSYTWAENGMTYTASGIYTSVTGCHTEILDLTVIPSTSNTTTLTVCDSYTWAENGMTYTTSGIYTVVTGCHTEILDLTVIPSTTNTSVISACDSYFWAENGMTYTASGIYTVVTGCHTEILDLTINPSYFFTENASVFDYELPYVWQGNSYMATGTYYATYLTQFGCDSIYELNLIVKVSEPLWISKNVGTAVQANWSPISGATLYQLRYRVAPAGPWMYVAQSTQLTRKVYPLTPGTTYEMEIRHKVGATWQDWSTTFAPIIFTANVIDYSATYDIGTKFLLEWTELDEVSSYILQYKKATDVTWITKGYYTTNTAVMGALDENTSYNFRVCPRYDEISFNWTQVGTITSNYIVINVANYTGGTSADFSWAPVMNPAADAYYLQTREVGMTTLSSYYTTTNSRSVTNLIAGASYEYRLVVRYAGVSWGATSWRPLVAGSKEESTVIQPMNDLNVYPNPVSDILTVEIMSTADTTHVWNLYDVNGKLVMSGTNTLTSGLNYMQIETGHLSTGLYMLQSNFNGMMRTSRIIKQ